jgi:flagellar biosynthesis/type III secretory pathway chaperone
MDERRPDALSAQELGGLLAQLDGLANQVLASLGEIRTALATANSSTLVRVLEKESAILTHLAGLAPVSDGAGDRQPGIEDLVRSVEPDGGPLQRRWESLRSTLLRCNAVNRANGMAVNMMEQRVRLAISLLRQGSAATVAYGPAGTTVRSDARRRVTRA